MNFLRRLFGRQAEPDHRDIETERLVDQAMALYRAKSKADSREVVYYVANFLAQVNCVILDASLLRYPKDVIYEAFHAYLTQLRSLAEHSSEAKAELAKVEMVYVFLADFQEIDPEDQELVSEINTGLRFAKFRDWGKDVEAFKAAREQDPDNYAIMWELEKNIPFALLGNTA